MAFDIPIVLDEHTFTLVANHQDKHVKFLIFYLSEKDTKAVVPKTAWKNFNKFWDEELKDSPESKHAFNMFISGVVRPYRKEGTAEDVELTNPIEEIIRMVNRDYDVVEHLIVATPSAYDPNKIKLPKEYIVDLKGFYAWHEVGNTHVFQEFSKHQKS